MRRSESPGFGRGASLARVLRYWNEQFTGKAHDSERRDRVVGFFLELRAKAPK